MDIRHIGGVMQTVTVEFGAWEPDAALLNGQQAPEARNVIPAKRGYRSMPGMDKGRYAALSDPALEMFSTKQMDGTILTYAATSDDIYALEGGVWTSRYSATPLTDGRYFVQYGDEMYALWGTQLVRQAAYGQAFEAVTLANGYVGDAPAGAVLGTIRDFLVIGQLSSTQNAIQWSGIDRPDTWYAPGSNNAQYVQSDIQVFPVGGNVQTIVGAVGGVDGLIFLERAIQRATYVGPPYIFQFDPIDWQQGALSPKSPVVCGQMCFFLSEDGWKATDGASVRPIGLERVDRWFFSKCDSERIKEVRGVHDARHRLAVWSFPTSGAPSGTHDMLLIYSYALDKWSYAQINVECLFGDYTRGMTLEQLDSLSEFQTDDGMDVEAPSLDSEAFKNGMRLLGCVDTNHTMGALTGQPLEAVIDTAEYGGSRMMVHGFRPLVDSGNAQAMPIWRILQKYGRKNGKYSSQQRDGVCYQHLSCDYVSARIKIPAAEEWRNAVAVEALIEEEGGL
jgi:hypothetical protein